MDKISVSVEPITNADISAAGGLMENMWRLHGQKTSLVDETKILNVRGADYIKDMLNNDQAAIFVARAGGEVVGVASCLIQPLPSYYSERSEAYIDDVSVAPAYQRQGIASRLMRACEGFASDHGVKVLSAKVWAFNHQSAAMVERNGFTNDYALYHKIVEPGSSL